MLPRRERLIPTTVTTIKTNFNPRSHEGNDRIHKRIRKKIHNFNPRSREGSDFHQSSFNIYIFNFNPRSREGSDLSNFIPNVFFINFNPRSREGSDATIPTNCNRYDRISIHAPAKGATWCIGYQTFTATFQSTLPRRERQELRYQGLGELLYFNPRSREGSDYSRGYICPTL